MSGVNNVNITLLKQYQEEFSVEKDNFNNSSYNYFLTSYIPHCSDYYVAQMSKTLDDLYDKIKNGYYNINVWWVNHNNSIEEVEDSLMDNGIKPEDVMDNFGDVNAGAAAGALAAGAAAVGGFASQAMVDAAGNVGSSEMNLNNMDASTTGATTSSNTQNLWSRFTNWVSNAAKDTGAWISNAWNTASNWVSEKATAVKDMASNVLSSTGAFLSNAWNSITSLASDAYETINNALLAVEASVNNAVISLSKGIVILAESVGDLLLLAGAGIVSVGTLVVDGWNSVFNGQEGLVYTNLLWNDAKTVVSYNWTDKIYDSLYETEFGQYLDEHAIGFFKSDGMGCQILEGVGYAAGVVGLSVVTFGTATPLVLGGTAAATGFSKYTAQEWNENSFTISYDGVNTMDIALDYNQYLDLENLNIGDSRDFTQTFLDEEGNQMDITFTITKNGSNDYSVVDSYGNNLVFAGLNESDTAKGLALGAVYGIWEGLQYAVGAKIGTSTFSGITSNITNTAAQKLAVSGLRVASDTLTGVVEVPFQSAVTTLADGVSFSEAWEQNGGFTSVLTQAGIAGIGSVLGEAFDLGKMLNGKGQADTINLDNAKPDDFLQNITINAQNMDNQTLIQAFKSLDNPDVLLNALDDKKLRALIGALDDETLKKIYNNSDLGRRSIAQYLNPSRIMSLEVTPIFRIREEAIKLITDEHGRIDYTSINKLNDTQLRSLCIKTDSVLVDAVRLMDDETLIRFVELANNSDAIGNILNVLPSIKYFALFDGLSQNALFKVVSNMDENHWNFIYKNSTPIELENITNRLSSFNDEQMLYLVTLGKAQNIGTMFSSTSMTSSNQNPNITSRELPNDALNIFENNVASKTNVSDDAAEATYKLLNDVRRYNALLQNSKRYGGDWLPKINAEMQLIENNLPDYISRADIDGLKNAILSISDSSLIFKYMPENQIKSVLSLFSESQLDQLIRTTSNQKIIFDNLNPSIIEGSVLLTLQKKLVDKAAADGMNLREFGAQKNAVPDDVILKAQELSSQIRNKAVMAESKISRFMKSLETENTKLEGFNFKLKSLDSLTRKIISDANFDNISLEKAAANIGDSLRYTYVVGDDRLYLDVVQNNLDRFVEAGYRISKVKNFWNKPGFKGINTSLITPDGLKIEVQFHTRSSYHVKEDLTHLFYEIFRNENVPDEYREIANEIQMIYQKQVYIPDGVKEYDYFNSLNHVTYESIQSLSTKQIKNLFEKATDEEINVLFGQFNLQQRLRLATNTDFVKELIPKLNMNNLSNLINATLYSGTILDNLTNIMIEKGVYNSFLNQLSGNAFASLVSNLPHYNIPKAILLNILPNLTDINIATILSSKCGWDFNSNAKLSVERLANVIANQRVTDYNFLNSIFKNNTEKLLNTFSSNKEIYSKMVDGLSSDVLMFILKDDVLDIPQEIKILTSTGLEKSIPTIELLTFLKKNTYDFKSLLDDVHNKSGVFTEYNRFEYAQAIVNLYDYLRNNGYSIWFNNTIRQNALTLMNNFALPFRNINLNLWADTVMVNKLLNENSGYVSEEKIMGVGNTFEFQEHEEFFAKYPNKNSMGYNNGVKSVLDLKYEDHIIRSSMTHETIHQISFKRIDSYSHHSGVQYAKWNPIVLKWDVKRTGLNESITEFINQRTMGADYPNFCGYIDAVSCLRQIASLNIKDFDIDAIKKAYFGNDVGILKNAIDDVMYTGFFDEKLVPAFDKAASPSRDTSDLNDLVRMIALTVKGG